MNNQILSTATTADLLALGLAKPESAAFLDAMTSQALSLAMQNAVARQQADRIVSQALISAACANLLARAGVPSPHTPPLAAAPAVPAKASTEQPS
ncbi:RebB family R body protein [Caulobacter sp. SL161]|uniref:RebB family R body protein n=1 Tax=Caulobacter sp. SL161 TaxID=2995156 RepID=UPI002274CA8E|nr:RebB family R body protein [Caulobacter sp. SL161]MCY1647034.1 RebB family R body protein [Caulobacter sp. SL161]